MELSEFQKVTQERVKKPFAEVARVAHFELCVLPQTPWKTAAGQPEEIGIKFAFDGYTSWIYADGADVTGGAIDKRFEFYDYPSLDKLQEEYVAFVHGLLGHKLGPRSA